MENLQLMWLTIALQSNIKCEEIVRSHGRIIHEFPVDDNAFFECVVDQLQNHPVMYEQQQVITASMVHRIVHQYIVDNAESLQVM